MMSRCNSDQLKLTHIPTGLNVVVDCAQFPRSRPYVYSPRVIGRAKSWLAAKLYAFRNPEPPRPVRTYTLAPEYAVGVRQGSKVLASGPGVYEVILDGKGLDAVMANARRSS